MVFILFKFVPCPFPSSSLGNRTTVCCTQLCPWSSAGPWAAVAGLCQGWVAVAGGCPCPWLCGAILGPCMTVGADVKLFGLPGPLPASWLGLSLLGAVLGIFPHPNLSLEGQLCSDTGAGTRAGASMGSPAGLPSPAAIPALSPVSPDGCCEQSVV